MLPRWARLILCAALPCSALKSLDASKPCNGDPGLCELSVDQVTWAGTHNADAAGLKINFMRVGCLTDNHEHHMIKELSFGLRFFDVDTCMQPDGSLRICHGPGLGKAFKGEMLATKDWMDKNPNEVIVLCFTNAKALENSNPSNWDLMERITGDVQEAYGDMLYVPPMAAGKLTHGWKTLGELVSTNKRVVVLWGKKLYYHIYRKDKKEPGFRNKHIWFQKYWAMTYGGSYGSMMPSELGDSLESFCDDPQDKTKFDKQQAMILVDGYLTISPKRKSFSFCNKDLAGDVNFELLEYKDLDNNPLVRMQSNCWAKKKQVSLLSMDYTQYFPIHLDRMARKLNERNFAQYGWIGGTMHVVGDQAATSKSALKTLIVSLAGLGEAEADRITVDKKVSVAESRRLDSGNETSKAQVYFSISAAATDPLSHRSNAEVLAKIKEAAKNEATIGHVSAVCRDPGVSSTASRSPPVQEELFVEGATLTFTCAPPLVAVHGSLTRTCGPDGLFDGMQPNCQEAWTSDTRLMPFWLKLLLIILSCLCVILCLCGCVFMCFKKCRKGGYSKVQEEQ